MAAEGTNAVEPNNGMTDSIEAFLLQNLGESFMAYVTASTPGAIRQRLTIGDEPLLGDCEVVLGVVTGLAAKLAPIAEQPELLRMQVTDMFGAFMDDAGTTAANMLRQRAGGEIWEPTSSEPVEQEILVQLRDIYPLMLLPHSSSPFDMIVMRLSGSLYRHPGRVTFEQATMNHHALIRLFPDEAENSGRTGHAYSSAGRGGTIGLWGFADQLIGAGWELARLSSKMPSLEEHVAGTKKALATLIAALDNKAATIPVHIGLTGVLLPEGCTEVDLRWARLRPADARDENHLVPSALPGEIQAVEQDGTTVTAKYSGDIVFEMNLPYRIRLGEMDRGDDWPDELYPHQTIEKHLDNVRLGLTLSLDVHPPVFITPSWTRIVDPLQAHDAPNSWNDPSSISHLSPRRLTTAEVDNWKHWAMLIKERRGPKMGTAIRRALIAVSERRNPEDMLVDAVVVWENLFGARQETTLRVTSSLAWLLAEDSADRKAKQQRFKEIYELRSGIVHGSRQITRNEARTMPYEAVAIALKALRALLRDRPDLLNETDSGARSNRLLLGY